MDDLPKLIRFSRLALGLVVCRSMVIDVVFWVYLDPSARAEYPVPGEVFVNIPTTPPSENGRHSRQPG